MTPTDAEIRAAAAAIANAGGARRGAPEIKNILDILPGNLQREVRGDAKAALEAAAVVRDALERGRP